MIINHNLSAINAHRQLLVSNSMGQKSLEKLSSGLRINRAADDAAGLAISEKMRGQIRGLQQAARNAQDGISLIQTAEGALNESHSIIQRMRELSVQAANDTNTDTDRAKLQQEMDQLAQELARIGDTTEFNTKKLLDGSYQGTFQIGANEGQTMSVTINDMRSFELGVAGNVKYTETVTPSGTTDFVDGEYTIDGTDLKDANGNVVATTADGGVTWTSSANSETITFTQAVDSGKIVIENGEATGTAEFTNDGLEAGSYTIKYAAGASEIVDANGNVIATSTDDTNFVDADGTTVLTLDAAATADMDITVGGADITSQSAAGSTITTVNNALDTISQQRSELGAIQNRLEHTIANLDTAAENLQAAESRIRDVDMAKEMMEFTRTNILQQAGTAMLAQANARPQTVLQLLG
ncbi:MAG: flagellin [Bacillaceae bacterium]|nr:flagellin [Bacillaceae bacterium]